MRKVCDLEGVAYEESQLHVLPPSVDEPATGCDLIFHLMVLILHLVMNQ